MLGKQSGQMGFGDMEATGRVPEGHFLKKIDGQIDWRPFEKVLEPLYHPTLGRPSHPPLVMFKALLLQQWYGLSDPGLEEAICDRLSFQRFLGLSLTDPVPDETRICRFRTMLAQAGLGERLFALLEEQLDAKGMIVRRGSLIDATLIKAQPHPPRRGRAQPRPRGGLDPPGQRRALWLQSPPHRGSRQRPAPASGSDLGQHLRVASV